MERIFFTFESHTLNGKQLSYETVKTLQELLRGVVTREKGTGTAFRSLPLSVAWKIRDSANGERDEGESPVCRLFSV